MVEIGILQVRGLVGSGRWGHSTSGDVGHGACAGGGWAVAASAAVGCRVRLLDDGLCVGVGDPFAFVFGALGAWVVVGGGRGSSEGSSRLGSRLYFSLFTVDVVSVGKYFVYIQSPT